MSALGFIESGFDLFLSTKCSMHTTCVVCINIVFTYLALIHFMKICR